MLTYCGEKEGGGSSDAYAQHFLLAGRSFIDPATDGEDVFERKKTTRCYCKHSWLTTIRRKNQSQEEWRSRAVGEKVGGDRLTRACLLPWDCLLGIVRPDVVVERDLRLKRIVLDILVEGAAEVALVWNVAQRRTRGGRTLADDLACRAAVRLHRCGGHRRRGDLHRAELLHELDGFRGQLRDALEIPPEVLAQTSDPRAIIAQQIPL